MSRTTTSPFDIKSATIQGLSLVLRTARMSVIEAELEARVNSAGDLFTNAPVLINVTALTAEGTAQELELTRLINLLRRHTMRAVGIVGASGPLLTQAQALGLTEEEDVQPRSRSKTPEPEQELEPALAPAAADVRPVPAPDSAVVSDLFGDLSTTETAGATHAQPDNAPAASALAQGQTAPTRVIDRSVRSGQQIYARGGDLVVLGMVSHGAEVIADGNIHVYGPLRGRAIAGASGDADARIFAAAMEPELVAIAGTYRTTDKPLANDVLGKPAQVRLHDDKLLLEPLKH
ncbi:MAG: septum site-determining protein MinC [Burkholderiaceae bacterium]